MDHAGCVILLNTPGAWLCAESCGKTHVTLSGIFNCFAAVLAEVVAFNQAVMLCQLLTKVLVSELPMHGNVWSPKQQRATAVEPVAADYFNVW
jgi:hypothetical protein